MHNVAIAIPTVTGREESFQRTVEGYRQTVEGSPHNVYIVTTKDQPTWGAGVEECMAQITEKLAQTTVVHITADDLVPEPGWLDVAIETIEKGICPAPVLDTFGHIDYGHPPTPEMEDWKVTKTSVIPTIKIGWWDHIAPMFVAHYFTDDYISVKLRMHAIETRGRLGYRFNHFHENAERGAGMSQDERMQHDMLLFQRWQMTGKLPPRDEMVAR